MIQLTSSNYKDYLKDGDSVLFYEGIKEEEGQVSKAQASDTHSGGFVVYGKQSYGSTRGSRGFSIELLLNKFTVKLLGQ
jgi:hypothetical protein